MSDWHVLAYVVGDDQSNASPLDRAGQREIREICRAADCRPLPVTVQVDFKNTPGVFRATQAPEERDFRRVDANQYNLWNRVENALENSRLLLEWEQQELNAANRTTVGGFIRYGSQLNPGLRSVVFFFGHAYGPLGMFFDRGARDSEPKSLRLNELAWALGEGADPAHLIVFRDCYMNTVEVAYQLRESARFILGSQAGVPIAGTWPWVGLLASLTPSASTEDVGESLALQLGEFYEHAENRPDIADVPYSLVAIDQVSRCVDPLSELVEVLDSSRGDPGRREAYGRKLEESRTHRAIKTADSALVDACTMCTNLMALGMSDPVYAPARALNRVLDPKGDGGVVRRHHSLHQMFNGLSLYYAPHTPEDRAESHLYAEDQGVRRQDENHFRQLALCRQTGWSRVALRPLLEGD